jgi:transcriptional antiterminator RfaH
MAERNLARQGIRVLAPVFHERKVRAGHKPVLRRKLVFPGYVFVHLPDMPRWFRSVNGTRGISRLIIGNPLLPQALPVQFMAGLIERCGEDGTLLEAKDNLAIGDRVRVVAGPFADQISSIEKLSPDARVTLLISFMGQSARLQVPSAQLVKIKDDDKT